jgi:hypothetical protein
VLSLLSSAVAESVEHLFHYRADYLRQGIEKLLLAGSVPLRARLYGHPLIKSLYTRSRLEVKFLRAGGPAYIPSRQFALALLDIATGGTVPLGARSGSVGSTPPAAAAGTGGPGAPGGPAPAAGNPTPPQGIAAQLLDAIRANPAVPPPVEDALRTLISDAGDDIEKVKGNVQAWFDGSMDRVAGWYKRRAQFVLLIIGTLVAVGINADTMSILSTLSNDSSVRTAVVSAAETYVRENPRPSAAAPAPAAGQQPAVAGAAPGSGAPSPPVPLDQVTEDIRKSVQAVSKQLGTLGLPVGWRRYDPAVDDAAVARMADDSAKAAYLVENRVWPASRDQWPESSDQWRAQISSHLLGWFLTAIAISFGAPFWFDTLNKIMVIRSTVKPREKSGDEGSEDR